MQINNPGGNKKNTTLFCFSPEVMIVTFTLEILLALYAFIKYRMTKFGRVAFFILIFLAFFQLAEYQICRGEEPLIWSRIGLFSITLLPVLGLYLVSLINKKTWLLYLGAILSFGFGLYFILVPKAIEGAACGGNYVVFNAPQGLFRFYGFYYFGFLLLAIWESFQRLKESPKNKILRRVLFWFVVGYLSFILPLTLVYIFIAGSRGAIAAIMCRFAIIFAIILAFKILPLYHLQDDHDTVEKKPSK
jgi:hypothetical protein